ncbi:MAG: ComF family protein [Thermodesulfobacteriota bacterium]
MARALGHYEGVFQKAIHRWKYEGIVGLSPLFGEWMAAALPQYWDPKCFDLILPVPLHKERLRERGFNQALLLARELSRRTGIPYGKNILQKKRPTLPQVQLSGAERERAVRKSFHVLEGETLKGKTILLVDDVYTTGSTVNECSRVLLASGVIRIDVFTLTHAVKIS